MSTRRSHSDRICKSTKLPRRRPSSTSKSSSTQIEKLYNLRVTPSSASKPPDSIKRTPWRIWWRRRPRRPRPSSRGGRSRKYRISRWRGGQGSRRRIGSYSRLNNSSSRDKQRLRVPYRDTTWWVKGAWKANKARGKHRQPVRPEGE